MSVEVAVEDRMIDIVAMGFDAGLRFGGTVPEDLVAVRLGGQLRWVAAASPNYLSKRPLIAQPEDLMAHECIQIRTGEGVIYRWEFERDGDYKVLDVPGRLCTNETTFGVEMALVGRGIVYCLEDRIARWTRTGELQVVLPDWAPMEPAFHIYYPLTRQMPPGLREMIDTFREGMESRASPNL
jgi:DNA-binding transcriptional LysR family regulator